MKSIRFVFKDLEMRKKLIFARKNLISCDNSTAQLAAAFPSPPAILQMQKEIFN